MTIIKDIDDINSNVTATLVISTILDLKMMRKKICEKGDIQNISQFGIDAQEY